MARLIQKEIKDPLADEILFGALKQGGRVEISLRDDQLHFSGHKGI
jgi:ATP-dependent Clp protease ATP-binding subunit ClpA